MEFTRGQMNQKKLLEQNGDFSLRLRRHSNSCQPAPTSLATPLLNKLNTLVNKAIFAAAQNLAKTYNNDLDDQLGN